VKHLNDYNLTITHNIKNVINKIN